MSYKFKLEAEVKTIQDLLEFLKELSQALDKNELPLHATSRGGEGNFDIKTKNVVKYKYNFTKNSDDGKVRVGENSDGTIGSIVFGEGSPIYLDRHGNEIGRDQLKDLIDG